VLEDTSGEPLVNAELRFHQAGMRDLAADLGLYTTQTLPPGNYLVATEESVHPTPESIGRLWRARNRYREVDLPPSGSTQVKLEPGKIE
jgi:hypothetical protein